MFGGGGCTVHTNFSVSKDLSFKTFHLSPSLAFTWLTLDWSPCFCSFVNIFCIICFGNITEVRLTCFLLHRCLVLYFPQCAEKKRRLMFVVAVAVCSVVGSIYVGCKKVRIFTVTQGPLSVVTLGRAPGISTKVSAARGQCLVQGLGICLLATVALYVFVRCCGSKIPFSLTL